VTLAIYVFERPDGRLWADYSKAFAERSGKVVHTIVASTRAEIEGVVREPGVYLPERVRALAERALAEFLARGQQPEPAARTAAPEPAPEAKLRPWWRRLLG
jgi:hypothetical protein